MKHLLKLGDLSREDILSVLNLADQLKFERNNGIQKDYLKGKKLGMIFQKASTRTRVSFEVGMYELGGYALFLSSNDLQIGRGEPVRDTARVLSRYLDGIMIRTFAQKEVEDLAEFAGISVATLSKLERGLVLPTVETSFRLAKALNMTISIAKRYLHSHPDTDDIA